MLVATQVDGNATDAPWPFRVDAVSGAFLNGHKSGEQAFALRLDAERAPLAAVEADPRCALLASLAPRELGCVVAVAQSEQARTRARAHASVRTTERWQCPLACRRLAPPLILWR